MSGRSERGVRLEARGIVKLYDGLHAVDNVDLVAEPGQVAAIVGPNGAGKTTLFHCLSGYLLPDEGSVHLGTTDVTNASSDARARLGLARTFQHSSVFASLTVEENLLVGAENRRRDGITRGLVGLPDRGRAATHEIVDRVASQLGLDAYRHATAATLPTGRLRLVELGRALCSVPSVLLLDEPASGLDDDETEELRGVLRALADSGLALLLVEHDLSFIRDTANVVHAMAAGRIVASGPPSVIEADAAVRSFVLDADRVAR
jgi:branched-chain amino acid transport system ATP-binding protein